MALRTDARHGFTLLEATVALAMIGAVSVAALAAFAAEMRTTDMARRALPAVFLARQRLAALELSAVSTALGSSAIPDTVAHGQFQPPFDAYAWSATIVATHENPSLYDATVDVTWDGGDFTLRTRLFQPPVSPSNGP
jgi:prepilin-type N-terminal cleavage/methylation domain-containing protein